MLEIGSTFFGTLFESTNKIIGEIRTTTAITTRDRHERIATRGLLSKTRKGKKSNKSDKENVLIILSVKKVQSEEDPSEGDITRASKFEAEKEDRLRSLQLNEGSKCYQWKKQSTSLSLESDLRLAANQANQKLQEEEKKEEVQVNKRTRNEWKLGSPRAIRFVHLIGQSDCSFGETEPDKRNKTNEAPKCIIDESEIETTFKISSCHSSTYHLKKHPKTFPISSLDYLDVYQDSNDSNDDDFEIEKVNEKDIRKTRKIAKFIKRRKCDLRSSSSSSSYSSSNKICSKDEKLIKKRRTSSGHRSDGKSSSSHRSSSSWTLGHSLHIVLALLCLNSSLVSRTGASSRLLERRQAVPISQQVPYTTVLVSRACEWKSNLFVPSTNDILFAQQPDNSNTPPILRDQTQKQTQLPAESTILYENPSLNRAQYEAGRSDFAPVYSPIDIQSSASPSRTLLTSESRALVLAFPLEFPASFQGFEPACSIRLIVPQNMRILAQLTSRRLEFKPEQVRHQSMIGNAMNFNRLFGPFDETSNSATTTTTTTNQLNVSSNGPIGIEQTTIESEKNILTFRFLLERFAHQNTEPETRFHLVATAFQTLGENSDIQSNSWPATSIQFNGPNKVNNNNNNNNNFGEQLICDKQRLISANLACDGYKNCLDGHDEETSTCSSFRINQNNNIEFNVKNRPSAESIPSLDFKKNNDSGSIFTLLDPLNLGLGSILIILLLIACLLPCLYFAFLLLFRSDRLLAWFNNDPPRSSLETKLSGSLFRKPREFEDEAATKSLTDAQNVDNLNRLRALQSHSNQPRPPPRLQSILKRPRDGVLSAKQHQLHTTGSSRPDQPPPEIPQRRGALSSSLNRRSQLRFPLTTSGATPTTSTTTEQQHSIYRPPRPSSAFRPTPAQRLTRPTRQVPVPLSIKGAQSSSDSSAFGAPSRERSGSGQRITTYHYSGASTAFSQAYLERLAATQRLESREESGRRHSAMPTNSPSGDNQTEQARRSQGSVSSASPNSRNSDSNNLTSLI